MTVSSHPTLAPPDPGALRACLSRFATGVTVVTYNGDDGPRGATMNSFTSVSAEPPLVLVSVARRARCHDRLTEGPFCVNVLGAEQEPLAKLFAGAPEPVRPDWVQGALAPRIAHSLAWVECAPWRSYDGGDHTLVVGEVVDLGHRDGDALTYAWSRFGTATESAGGIEHLF
ncbi:flavin reductase family protein [Streptomyces ipomoeae]|uniref:flavin reductase family protein n=1 Tax=Streptomyces ipomoeae TaxID=103232 RepID=UPI0011470843|nr:flavin reductase family protein [Streptomyces ipomoeae]MDX2931357.1 flavin reductase family protein [Streptomyces ipomoeae]TQE16133.1 flavin reductase [Streptomyces ipomoeae]